MGILYFLFYFECQSIIFVLAKEQLDLDRLFYPVKIGKSTQARKPGNYQVIPSSATQETESDDEVDHQIIYSSITQKQDHISASSIRNMMSTENDEESKQDTHVAGILRKRIRLLCLVLTCPSNHTRAIHVKETWGKKCDVLLFISTEDDQQIPTVKLPVREGRDFLWGKTKAAFEYAYKNYLHKIEWFLKTDDDTYVVVENLKYFLDEYNTNDPLYFGSRYKCDLTKDGYFSGGAGYVMSREALIRFVTLGVYPELCRIDDRGAEDLELGICMDRVQVFPMDSRDKYQRGRFFPFRPCEHVQAIIDPKYWYWQNIYYKIETGRNCCSEYTISFHYVDPNLMHILDYFVYHLRPYGIKYNYQVTYNSGK